MNSKESRQEQTEALRAYRIGDHYFVDYKECKLSRVKYGPFMLIYGGDHDKRYAHISKKERWKYPDVVEKKASPILIYVYKRDKTSAEIKAAGGKKTSQGFLKLAEMDEDFDIFSKDTPITDIWRSIYWIH